jgi:hypothetical protein
LAGAAIGLHAVAQCSAHAPPLPAQPFSVRIEHSAPAFGNFSGSGIVPHIAVPDRDLRTDLQECGSYSES